ncbi:Fc receptor-like protein 3 [Manis javanica]|nr:Fc receptor-like protein 3 [Manis javanica]
MLLWLLFLLLAPGREQSGIAPKAFILLQPPWSRFFKEDIVTLTCKDAHSSVQGGITWYWDRKRLERESEEIQINTPGYYNCKTRGSSLSDAVLVEFLSDWLILQASYPVFEGDDVVLRCRAQKEEKASEKIYYKNKKRLSDSYSSEFMLNSVSRDNGKYHCTASKEAFFFMTQEISKPLMIQVQELFSPPVLRASPSHSIEGNPVTLKCETSLSPQKSDTQLQFRFFKEKQVLGSGWSSAPELRIPALWAEDSWSYWCQAETMTHNIIKRSRRSQIQVQRVPVSDVTLETQPREGRIVAGGNLVLICSVAKGTGTITFSWHREGIERSLGRKTQRSLSAELQISSVKEHDAGRYYCAADNSRGPMLSQRIRVALGIPVSLPVLILRVPRAQAVVGDVMELHCEAQRGSPPILYWFYHEDVALGNSSAPFGGGASFNLSLTAEHSGNYSCEADNSLGAQRSDSVTLKVTVPVSRPILTLNPVGAQDMVSGTLELHCEAQRGSPPILYWFFHEDATLGNSSAPSGGGASFNLSLMEEHSGNYSCTADNGLGAQRSEVVTLNFTGPSRNKGVLIPVRVTGWLLSILGLAAAVVLVGHFRTQRKSGGLSASGTPSPSGYQEPSLSSPSSTDPQEPTHCEPLALTELQPVYSNVNPEDSNLVYSHIWSVQHTKENSATKSPRLPQEDKEPVVIYSELKKAHPDDPAEPAGRRSRAREEATDNYENVP